MRATYGTNITFTLMNSFSTSADTKEYLSKQHEDLMSEPTIELMQNMSPKVDAATLEPVSYPESPDLEWWVKRGGGIGLCYVQLISAEME